MVSSEPVLLIVAADRREFSGIQGVKRIDLGLRWSARAVLGGSEAILAAHGAGCENAARAVRTAAAAWPVAAVVSTGYAGALDPRLRPGDVFIANSVRRGGADVEYPVSLPVFAYPIGASAGQLLTIDYVAQTVEEKARLCAGGAAAVDMEAAAVAQAAQRLGAPFYCVRCVSDAAHTEFVVDFNRAMRKDGSFSGWRIAVQAGLSPRRWLGLLELKRGADLASASLARALEACRFPSNQP